MAATQKKKQQEGPAPQVEARIDRMVDGDYKTKAYASVMVNQSTEKKNTRQIQMTIEGHKVTISFAQEANPTLSALVRNTLLDAYIRKNGLCSEEQPA